MTYMPQELTTMKGYGRISIFSRPAAASDSFDLVSSVSKTSCLGLPELNEDEVDDVNVTLYLLLFDEL